MSYEVLARKFRPRNLSELVGQDSIRQTLTNALRKDRLYPVLLFAGPRGTGKTSSARILAKILRCPHKKDLIPCDECKDCLLIQESRHLDVIEIDGASNTGVDSIRELKDNLSYMPTAGQWKIYIIDEVHMLSNSAFNALLKTLEEPPAHIIFIFATTESHKIPSTVLSRAQRLDFHTLAPGLIKNQLELICKKEKLAVPEEVLWTIARQAQGSLRDAQSLLDQLLTFSGGEDLSVESASKQLGLSDPLLTKKALKALVQGEEQAMALLIEELRVKGTEPKVFLQSLCEGLSRFLFLKKNPENRPELVYASKEEIQEMQEEIREISYEHLHFLFDMLLKGEKEMAYCHDSRLALEVFLLRASGAGRLESLIPFNPLKEVARHPHPVKQFTDVKTKKFESSEEEVSPPLPAAHKPPSPIRGDREQKTEAMAAKKVASSIKPSVQAISQSPVEKQGAKEDQLEGQTEVQTKKTQTRDPITGGQSETTKEGKKLAESAKGLRAQTEQRDQGKQQFKNQEEENQTKVQTRDQTKDQIGYKPEKAEAKDQSGEPFDQRQEFFEFLKVRDSGLSHLAGKLRIERHSSGHFRFSAPESFSWLKKKLSEPHTQRLFTSHLRDFLQLSEKVNIEFVYEKGQKPGLREEREKLDKAQKIKQLQQDPFVKEVKALFQTKT